MCSKILLTKTNSSIKINLAIVEGDGPKATEEIVPQPIPS
jgi:hypothetical protein